MLDEELGILNRNNFQINDSIRNNEQQNNQLIDSIERVSDSMTANENRLLIQRTQQSHFLQ